MLEQSHHALDPELYPSGTRIESGTSAVAWTAIVAGSVTSVASWLVLLTLGTGLGLAEAASWPAMHAGSGAFHVAAGIWLIVTQWLAFAMGGYIAGRLRVRWVSLHTDEVFFRDTAHGLLTWALSTVVVAGLAVLVTALTSPQVAAVPDLSPEALRALQKAAAASAIFSAIAMVIGGFVAAVAAVIGGRLRDRHP